MGSWFSLFITAAMMALIRWDTATRWVHFWPNVQMKTWWQHYTKNIVYSIRLSLIQPFFGYYSPSPSINVTPNAMKVWCYSYIFLKQLNNPRGWSGQLQVIHLQSYKRSIFSSAWFQTSQNSLLFLRSRFCFFFSEKCSSCCFFSPTCFGFDVLCNSFPCWLYYFIMLASDERGWKSR